MQEDRLKDVPESGTCIVYICIQGWNERTYEWIIGQAKSYF
jgi:hypothetical protein